MTERHSITLRNHKTGEFETFVADDNGVITLPAGEWSDPRPRSIPEGVVLQGQGFKETVLRTDDST